MPCADSCGGYRFDAQASGADQWQFTRSCTVPASGAAVVMGASGGIGAAFEAASIEEGAFDVVYGFARSRTGPQHLDLEDEASIAAAVAHVAKGPQPPLVIVATGLLHLGDHGPENTLRELDPMWMAKVHAVNAIGPALVAKHFLPIMPKSGRTVFAALSARAGSITDNRLGGWYSYRASKAALNMLVRNLAIEEQRRNARAIVVALHPGTVDTVLSRPFRKTSSPDGCSVPNERHCNFSTLSRN